MVREHLELQGLQDLSAPALLIVNRDSDGLSYSNWCHRIWVPATFGLHRAGLQFHDLRRTNATGLIQEGVDTKTAQVHFGHSDPRLTIGLYAQIHPTPIVTPPTVSQAVFVQVSRMSSPA
jgi:site-specific recombinase XerD